MSNSFKNTAYVMIQNRHHATASERGDDSCDELLIDTEEPANAVVNSNFKKVMHENLLEDKYSEEYCHNSKDLSPSSMHDAHGINEYSETCCVNEISDKFSKLNTSSRISDSSVLNSSTCHSDPFEVLEEKSHCMLVKKTSIKCKKHEHFQESPCFGTRGLFHVSETPDDFCTKFKTLLGSNEKLITLDNVRDIKFKTKDFIERNDHGFAENKQTQVSKSKDIFYTNFVKSDTRISSNIASVGETSEKYKSINSASNSSFRFTKNTLTEKDKIKVRMEEPNVRSKEKFVFDFEEDLNAKTSNEVMLIPKPQIENAPKRPKLRRRRIGLPSMQCSLNDLDTLQFDQRNSISFGLPNPNKLPNCKNMQSSKQSRKRLASSPTKNMSEFVGPPSTISTKRRTDNQPDEPSSKFRKRCLSSTDAEAGETVDMIYRVRSSSDGKTRESVNNESLCVTSSSKRGDDDRLTHASCETQYTFKKLRQNNNLNPMQ